MSSLKRSKFKIEPYKHPLKADPAYREKTWKVLEDAVHEINNHNASGLSFEELYRNAYNMVINKFGDRLYSGLVETLTRHLRGVADRLEGSHGENFLRELKQHWDHHNKSMQMIRDILMYMDRVYVKQHNLAPVHQLGLNLWRDHVVRRPPLRARLQAVALDAVQRERCGEVVDRGLLRAAAQMLTDLGPAVYQEDLERHFLERTAEFYRVEAQTNASACDCPEYLRRAERRLAEEAERVGSYLDPGTEPKVKRVLEAELIGAQMRGLAEMEGSGLVALLLHDRLEDLGRMHALFRRVPGGQELLCDLLGAHLRATGRALVTDGERTKDPVEFVQTLLAEKAKYDRVISQAMGGDKALQNVLNAAFEHFLNLNPRTPEYLSLFLDERLRRGARGGGEDDVEACLDSVVLLFRYLAEKDVFEKYYKQHLAKRLLSGRAVSDDAERSVLVKLKTECGYQYTSKLESMFTDIRTSRDMMQEFRAQQAAAAGPSGADLDLSVQVLTTGSWPGETAAKCNLPRELEQACQAFQEFYLRAYSGRRLAWQTNKGHADLKACLGGKRHELSVNTYQMCVLMLFNEADALSFREIRSATAIPDADLRRTLQSLACVKGRNVLRKEPQGREVEEGDAFHFNDQFQSKLFKIKVGTITAQKETEPEKQETRQKVEEDRKPLIEASIVRVLKARRVLDHNSVVAEVTRQLSARFTPAPAVIKKRIESLIDREFLERDAGDRRLYRYMA